MDMALFSGADLELRNYRTGASLHILKTFICWSMKPVAKIAVLFVFASALVLGFQIIRHSPLVTSRPARPGKG